MAAMRLNEGAGLKRTILSNIHGQTARSLPVRAECRERGVFLDDGRSVSRVRIAGEQMMVKKAVGIIVLARRAAALNARSARI